MASSSLTGFSCFAAARFVSSIFLYLFLNSLAKSAGGLSFKPAFRRSGRCDSKLGSTLEDNATTLLTVAVGYTYPKVIKHKQLSTNRDKILLLIFKEYKLDDCMKMILFKVSPPVYHRYLWYYLIRTYYYIIRSYPFYTYLLSIDTKLYIVFIGYGYWISNIHHHHACG